jgi:hypothetical protein
MKPIPPSPPLRRSLRRWATVAVTFHPRYALAALLVFLLEVAIALWVRDQLIRPHLGDSLAVVLVYCVLRTSTRLRVVSAVLAALAVAFMIETVQFFGLVEATGLANSIVAPVLLGMSFDPQDLLAYVLGGLVIIMFETVLGQGNREAVRPT